MYSFIRVASLGLLVATLAACDPIYPLVANGYSQSVTVTLWDEKGKEVPPHNLLPHQCIELIHQRPTITRIVVKTGARTQRDYASTQITDALNRLQQDEGVFVVDDAGLKFIEHYKCSH